MRASDGERDQAVRRLRDAAVDGRLSPDTFVARVDHALSARHRQALAEVLADLPGSPVVGRRAIRHAWLAILADLVHPTPTAKAPAQHFPALRLPTPERPILVVGRNQRCDLYLPDKRVSRTHAVLMLFGGRWHLGDLDSTNGTLVNGAGVRGLAKVRVGDRVSFAGFSFRLAAPTRTRQEISSRG